MSLRPFNAEGVYVEAFREQDATVKNNTLAAATAENMAVPTGAEVVYLIADQDLWYNLDVTAVIPTDDSTDHRFLPAGLERGLVINGVTNISLISASIARASGRFW
jgi:hypothetical protein